MQDGKGREAARFIDSVKNAEQALLMQVQHYMVGRADSMVTSTWMGLKNIYLQGGFRALFAGLSINYMKVVPSTAIGFTVYDSAKQYLGLSQNL